MKTRIDNFLEWFFYFTGEKLFPFLLTFLFICWLLFAGVSYLHAMPA